MRRMRRALGGGACLALAAAAIPAASSAGQPPGAAGRGYVALGSSVASGPGVGARAPDAPAACQRSAENYAHRLARARGLALTDVTCAGATTRDVLEGGRLPAQVDAVGADTRLVTVTIGGNDVGYFGTLAGWSCRHAPPSGRSADACPAVPPRAGAAEFAAIEGRLRRIVAAVRRRAPRAVVVFVDYPAILPDTGGCPDRLPLSPAEVAAGRAIAARLAAATARAARAGGARLLRASTLSRGHDVCAADAWMFPYAPGGGAAASAFPPMPYHPNGASMGAVADALDRMLPRAR